MTFVDRLVTVKLHNKGKAPDIQLASMVDRHVA